MPAVILSVGDELVSGAIVDTNSACLSAALGALGIGVLRHVTVGDDLERQTAALRSAAAEADLVLLTGGLGPTVDDLSRQALAAAMGVDLVEDAQSLARIEAFFTTLGRAMNPSNRTQALVPRGAEALPNDCGTAPGLAGRIGSAAVYVLPGPPHEMRDMFAKRVAPRLPRQGALAPRVLHTFGAGESEIGHLLADLMRRGRNPAVGTTASGGVVSVRVVARGATPAEADALADADAGEIRRRLGMRVFAQGEQTLADVVGAALARAGQTLALAESCTGGLLGQMITSVAGSSAYFLGGVIAYANAAKTALLDVPADRLAAEGAVSETVARALAAGARQRFGADWALAVTGIAGPGGGSNEKPVGLVHIALAGPGIEQALRQVFPGDRQAVRTRAALAALNVLRLAMEPGAPR